VVAHPLGSGECPWFKWLESSNDTTSFHNVYVKNKYHETVLDEASPPPFGLPCSLWTLHSRCVTSATMATFVLLPWCVLETQIEWASWLPEGGHYFNNIVGGTHNTVSPYRGSSGYDQVEEHGRPGIYDLRPFWMIVFLSIQLYGQTWQLMLLV
jgi:hypothetical protein